MSQPLAIDLFCGLGGWTEGLLAEGYDVVGFDIERHVYGQHRYPSQLVLQDALTIHGKQFRNAKLIVASPPCQEFSYMAMPWQRAKQIARALHGEDQFPAGYTGSRTVSQLRALFDACFRIQEEASAAAGHRIPLVVENVKGAQPWVGRAAWHFGSFYLWGDVPALMPIVCATQKFNPDGTNHGQGSWFKIADSKNRGSGKKVPGQNWSRFKETGEVSPHWRMEATKNEGGSWFNQAHNKESGVGMNPVHAMAAAGLKTTGHVNKRDGHTHTRHLTNQRESDAVKQHGSGAVWFDTGIAKLSSASLSRKAASAQIAKIPLPLAQHIARCYR